MGCAHMPPGVWERTHEKALCFSIPRGRDTTSRSEVKMKTLGREQPVAASSLGPGRRKAQRSPSGNVCICMAQSKEKLLKQVDSLRDLARRASRLSGEVDQVSDKEMLLRYAKELEDSAVRLEKEAAEAKTSPSRDVEPG